MSTINRQASGFSSKRKEGAHREFQRTCSNERRSWFTRYTSLEKECKAVRSLYLLAKNSISSPANATCVRDLSSRFLRDSRTIISSNYILHIAAISRITVDLDMLHIIWMTNYYLVIERFRSNITSTKLSVSM